VGRRGWVWCSSNLVGGGVELGGGWVGGGGLGVGDSQGQVGAAFGVADPAEGHRKAAAGVARTYLYLRCLLVGLDGDSGPVAGRDGCRGGRGGVVVLGGLLVGEVVAPAGPGGVVLPPGHVLGNDVTAVGAVVALLDGGGEVEVVGLQEFGRAVDGEVEHGGSFRGPGPLAGAGRWAGWIRRRRSGPHGRSCSRPRRRPGWGP